MINLNLMKSECLKQSIEVYFLKYFSKQHMCQNGNKWQIQAKSKEMLLILFLYLFYRFKMSQNKIWGKQQSTTIKHQTK